MKTVHMAGISNHAPSSLCSLVQLSMLSLVKNEASFHAESCFASSKNKQNMDNFERKIARLDRDKR